MRYLAVDYGSKRIGLAICDAAETIASPLAVIEGEKDPLNTIARIASEENVGAIVLGLPLNMDDSVGPQAKLVLQFAERLEKLVGLPVHYQDERLSSYGAEGKLAAGQIRRHSKKKHLDAIAAAEILEAFLEEKNAR